MKEDNSDAFSPTGMAGSSGSNHISFNVPWTPEHSGNLFSPQRTPPSEHFLTPMLGLMDTLPLSNDHSSIGGVDISMQKRIPTSRDWSPAISQMRNTAVSADFVFADATSPPRLPHKKRYELMEDIHNLMASPDTTIIKNNAVIAKRYKKAGEGYTATSSGSSATHFGSSNHSDSQNYYDHLEDDSFFSNVSLFNNRSGGGKMGIAEGRDLLGDDISYGDMTLEGSLNLMNTSSNKRKKSSSSDKSGGAKSNSTRKNKAGDATLSITDEGSAPLSNENSNDGSDNNNNHNNSSSSSKKAAKSHKKSKALVQNIDRTMGSPSDLAVASGQNNPLLATHISPAATTNGTNIAKPPPNISPAFPSFSSGVVGGGVGSENKQAVCNCKKSRCLKLYCDCFKQSIYCNGCNCNDCANNFKFESDRSLAVQAILDRNPIAFQPRVTKQEEAVSGGETGTVKVGHLSGCHCKKSYCLKKYCECFSGSAACTERCRCIDCRNAHPSAVAVPEPNLGLVDPM